MHANESTMLIGYSCMNVAILRCEEGIAHSWDPILRTSSLSGYSPSVMGEPR